MSVRQLHGWGRTAPSSANVCSPTSAEEVALALASAGNRGIVARGLGRSYGDAAQNGGGDVALMTALDGISDIDIPSATAVVQAGVSLDRLMTTLLPLGLWPAVSPGTRQVTVGGAIAADIHGKNHHGDGSFASHVRSLVLATPGLGMVKVDPDADSELFWATTGGMGLTGVVLEATIGFIPVETATMRVDVERVADLDSLMSRMLERDRMYRYSVAWIDCLATRAALGRSILELADHAHVEDLPSRERSSDLALRFSPSRPLPAPPWAPPGMLNRWTVAAFNEVWYHHSPRRAHGRLVPAASFFHPLDAVWGWNRIYGRRGFVQYQMVVPDGAEETLRRVLESLATRRAASFLGVLKRFGPGTPAPLSFPRPGWTLALDIPAGASGLGALLDSLDEMVVSAEGRIYLAKDSRLRPDLLEAMYPRLPEWRAVRDRADPDRRMQSDLARRLPLTEPCHEHTGRELGR